MGSPTSPPPKTQKSCAKLCRGLSNLPIGKLDNPRHSFAQDFCVFGGGEVGDPI